MTIHVDDLKIAGEHYVVQDLLKVLEREFGELTIQRGTFTNCGVQHVQHPVTREIALAQPTLRPSCARLNTHRCPLEQTKKIAWKHFTSCSSLPSEQLRMRRIPELM